MSLRHLKTSPVFGCSCASVSASASHSGGSSGCASMVSAFTCVASPEHHGRFERRCKSQGGASAIAESVDQVTDRERGDETAATNRHRLKLAGGNQLIGFAPSDSQSTRSISDAVEGGAAETDGRFGLTVAVAVQSGFLSEAERHRAGFQRCARRRPRKGSPGTSRRPFSYEGPRRGRDFPLSPLGQSRELGL